MKNIFITFLISILFFSCNKEEKNYVPIEGFITNGSGQRVFLEHNGLDKTTTLDSVDLDGIGQFHFKVEQPEYPDFYSLRINDKKIIFVVDSIGKKLTVNGDYYRFATEYNVADSPESESIKKLRKSVVSIQNKVNRLAEYRNTEKHDTLLSEIEIDIENHRLFAREIILKEARTLAAYFALFQKIDDSYIFSPYDEADLPYWRAVSTAYEVYMPDYERSKNLNRLVLDAIKVIKKQKDEIKRKEAMSDIMSKAVGYIDIALPERDEKERKLSELEGKVVLINFIAHEYGGSTDYNFSLRELYDKYHSKGFEIYQVALDRSKLFWEVATEALPWVCVYDSKGEKSYFASIYNVSKIPASFLMSRNGDIVSRDLSWDKLDKEIERLVKEKI